MKNAMVPEVLYLRRVHETNTTTNRPAQMDYLKIARAALERKRLAPENTGTLSK